MSDPEPTPSELVAGLDLAAKVRLLSGAGFWSLEAAPSAGPDANFVADGPHDRSSSDER